MAKKLRKEHKLKDKTLNFLDVNNSKVRTVKDDSKEKIELEIGDVKQSEMFPQAKIKKWDNETNFSIRYDNGAREALVEDGKFKFKSKDEEVHIYELDEFEDGGLEFEIVLNKKPKNNKFDFTIQHKGLDFFYQEELTQEQKENGVYRPPYVVGSYAVYHKTKKHNNIKGKNYKTGKAFHIYRPIAIDADGVETYADLNILNGVLSVTVPQDFLDKAKYPLIIDPTFGYETAGATQEEYATNDGFRRCPGYVNTLSGNFSIDSIHAYHSSENTSGVLTFATAVYNNSSSQPNTLLEAGSALGASSSTGAWKTFTISSTTVYTGGDMYIFGASNSSTDGGPYGTSEFVYFYYDSGSAGDGYIVTNSIDRTLYDISGDTWGTDAQAIITTHGASQTSNSNLYSYYITYTSAASSVNVNIKVSGTFSEKPIKIKKSGVFEDPSALSVKSGGVF